MLFLNIYSTCYKKVFCDLANSLVDGDKITKHPGSLNMALGKVLIPERV